KRSLRLFLRDDVVVEDVVDVLRLREVLEVERRGSRQLLVDDLVTEVDAFVADVDARSGDQLLDLALRLPAETAKKLLVAVCRSGHVSPFSLKSAPRLGLGPVAVDDYVVDDAVLLGFLRGHEVV